MWLYFFKTVIVFFKYQWNLASVILFNFLCINMYLYIYIYIVGGSDVTELRNIRVSVIQDGGKTIHGRLVILHKESQIKPCPKRQQWCLVSCDFLPLTCSCDHLLGVILGGLFLLSSLFHKASRSGCSEARTNASLRPHIHFFFLQVPHPLVSLLPNHIFQR